VQLRPFQLAPARLSLPQLDLAPARPSLPLAFSSLSQPVPSRPSWPQPASAYLCLPQLAPAELKIQCDTKSHNTRKTSSALFLIKHLKKWSEQELQ